MIYVLILLLGLPERICDIINYAEGHLEMTNYQNGDAICQNKQITKTQSFPGTFLNLPQMIFSLDKYRMESPYTEFTFTYSQGLTSFNATIICPQSRGVQIVKYHWIAIDDDRIRVIDQFVNFTLPYANKLYYSHDLTNAVAFTTYTSLGYSDVPYFRSYVAVINVTHIEIHIYAYGNTLSSGFQIVISASDFLIATYTYETRSLVFGLDPFKTLNSQKGFSPFLAECGINYQDTTEFLELEAQIQQDSTSVTFLEGSSTKLHSIYEIYHYLVFINNKDYSMKFPLLCAKIRRSKKKQTFNHNFQVYFDFNAEQSTAQTLYGAYKETFMKYRGALTTINLIVSMKCSPGKRIVGQVLQCIVCKEQYYDLSTNCYGGINFVEYRIRLFQKDQVNQKVTIDITESIIYISQFFDGSNISVLSIELI